MMLQKLVTKKGTGKIYEQIINLIQIKIWLFTYGICLTHNWHCCQLLRMSKIEGIRKNEIQI